MPMSINELEREPIGPIWVRNTSGPKTGGRGVVCLLVQYQDRSVAVAVPMTWVPVNLTEQLPKAALLQSAEFRRALRNGQLELLDDSEAEGELRRPGAAEESQRIARFTMAGGAQQQRSEASQTPNDEPGRNALLSTPVQGIIHTMSLSEPPPEIEVINSLRNLGSLSIDEIRAVGLKAKEVNFGEVRRYCKSELARLDPGQN